MISTPQALAHQLPGWEWGRDEPPDGLDHRHVPRTLAHKDAPPGCYTVTLDEYNDGLRP